MANNDNNLLLIILIGIVLFWIFNINTNERFKNNNSIRKNSINNLSEHFNKVDSPLLKDNSKVSDADLIDKLYAQSNKSTSSPTRYSNGQSPNSQQKLIKSPPSSNIPSRDSRSTSNIDMAKQRIPDSKQPMYTDDNYLGSNPPSNFKSFDQDNSYMLMDPNGLMDEKFKKVMNKETRPVLVSGDLLPKDEIKDWFQVPNKDFNLMQAVDLEVPEIKIGIDTVGQSRKNATYDLRAAPPNPKFTVSPWSNSTIEPDYNTKPLC